MEVPYVRPCAKYKFRFLTDYIVSDIDIKEMKNGKTLRRLGRKRQPTRTEHRLF